MLALLAICVLAFALLFLWVLRLLRDARARGLRAVRQAAPPRTSSARRFTRQSNLPETVLDESLSRLVPGKQPDWRFMVRERQTGRPTPRPDRAFSSDMGDLSDPAAPSRPERIRRAG